MTAADAVRAQTTFRPRVSDYASDAVRTPIILWLAGLCRRESDELGRLLVDDAPVAADWIEDRGGRRAWVLSLGCVEESIPHTDARRFPGDDSPF